MFTPLRRWLPAALLLLTWAAPAVAETAIQAMPLPRVDPSTEKTRVSRSQREMIQFDLRSRLENVAPAPTGGPAIATTEASDGQSFDKNFSAVSLIADPTVSPYPRHVRIEMDFFDVMGIERAYSCSGTLIDARHVITAAHCVYMWDDDGIVVNDWADSVRVYAGYNNGAGPIGVANGVQLRSWTGWTQDRDYDSDIALIDLDRPIGALAGWRGLGTHSDWDFFSGGGFNNYAYPGSDVNDVPVYNTQRMYTHAGSYDYDDGDQIGFDYSAFQGTSGSGAIKNNNVYAIRSHFEADTLWGEIVGWDTFDTRINSSKFNTIVGWMNADRPNGFDLTALDVRLTGESGLVGTPLPGLDFLVHNYSESSFNGTVYYTVYLSTDPNITSGDTYVYDSSVPANLNPSGSMRINVPTAAAVPLTMPSGDYFVGVIVNTSDGNASNNATGDQDVAPFNVQCATQSVPQPALPLDEHPCVPTDVSLNWTSAGPGAQYQLSVWKSQTEPTRYITSSTQHLVTGLQPGTVYWWQVRARTQCGSWGDWSLGFSFTTKGDLDNVVMTNPVDGRSCLGTRVGFSWSSKPTADMYRVQLVEVGVGTTVHDTPLNAMFILGLTPGAEYTVRAKARNECLEWGSYGPKVTFRIAPTVPDVSSPLSPIGGAMTLDTVQLVASVSPYGQAWEYEVETVAGTAVASGIAGPTFDVGPLAEGEFRWRVRMESCTTSGDQWSVWSGWNDFEVDLTAPAFASDPTVSPQTLGVWSTFDLANVFWDPATDQGGVAEYWYLFDQAPGTVPDLASNNPVVVTSPGIEANLPDGENWFHLVAVDHAGNVSNVKHVGPISIDTGPPSDPVLEGSIPADVWANVPSVQITWPESDDPGAGLAGYSFGWSTIANYVLDETVDVTSRTEVFDPIAEGYTYFFIRAIDNLGNAGPQIQYSFRIDRTLPEVMLFSPNAGQSFQPGTTIQIQFNAFDNTAGPQWLDYEHAYSVDGGASWYEITRCGQPTCGPLGGGGAPGEMYWKIPWAPPGANVIYRVTAIDEAGNRGEAISGEFFINTATAVDGTPVSRFELSGNHPNPFNPRTSIEFAIPRDAEVTLDIFDVQGRRVRRLVSELRSGPARYEVVWDGIDDNGDRVASGVYAYRLRAGDYTSTKRMTLLK